VVSAAITAVVDLGDHQHKTLTEFRRDQTTICGFSYQIPVGKDHL
jgi:hypothetical protein